MRWTRWNQDGSYATGITASAIAHLSVLTLVLLFTDVHPFGSVTAEPIAVEIVTPEEVAEKQRPTNRRRDQAGTAPTPQPDFSLDKPAAPGFRRRPTAPEPAAQPQKQARRSPPRPPQSGSSQPSRRHSQHHRAGAGLQAARARLSDQIPCVARACRRICRRRRRLRRIRRQVRRQFRAPAIAGRRHRIQSGRGIPAAPQDMLETAGLLIAPPTTSRSSCGC